MNKKFSVRLDEWVRKKEVTRVRKDKNLVTFLALKEDIKEALNNGFSMKTVWEFMYENEHFKLRYETFVKYVNKHIKNEIKIIKTIEKKPELTQQENNKTPKTKSPKILKSEKINNEQKHQDKTISGFVFDATPNKEDLI